jgi:large subunit ribosomal protein L21
MYAVIETAGKQFRVELGTTLEVDRLDAEPGSTLTLDRVLLVADGDTAEIGQPTVANASVSAEVVRAARGEKLTVFKYRPKARRRVKKGHRAELTVLRVVDIRLDGRSAAADEAKLAQARKSERERLAEAAARQAEADAALARKLVERAEAAGPTEGARPTPRTRGARSPAKAAPAASAPAESDRKPRRGAKARATEPAAPADSAIPADTETPASPRRTRRSKPTTEE